MLRESQFFIKILPRFVQASLIFEEQFSAPEIVVTSMFSACGEFVMPESSSNEFTETPEAIGCRDSLLAHYGKIGSSAIRAALCVSSKPKDEELSDNRAGGIPGVLRAEASAD